MGIFRPSFLLFIDFTPAFRVLVQQPTDLALLKSNSFLSQSWAAPESHVVSKIPIPKSIPVAAQPSLLIFGK